MAAQSGYGEFYANSRSFPFGILVANTWHALAAVTGGDIVAGKLSGVGFFTGAVCAAAASEADGGPGLIVRCATAHGLADGDLVLLSRMNNVAHDAPTRVTTIDTRDLLCHDVQYVAGAGASTGCVRKPAHLQVEAAGKYAAMFRVNATAESSAKLFEFMIAVEAAGAENTRCTRSTTATTGELICHGILDLQAGDRVWVMARNATNETDIIVSNCNLSIVQVG